jgi:hypothetical protein
MKSPPPVPHYLISLQCTQSPQHFIFRHPQSSFTVTVNIVNQNVLSYLKKCFIYSSQLLFIYCWQKIIPFLEHEPPPKSYKKLPSFWTNSANETTFCSVFSLLLSIHNFSALASFNEWVKFAVSSVTRTQTNLRMSLYFYIPHMKA